ncbi:MAG: NAD(P)H-dependent glycerol-3-phosphate dehydrogenase [Planctomycetota bacterium]
MPAIYHAIVHSIENIVVIGAGNWGLALASRFCRRRPVRVWTIDEATADGLRATRKLGGPSHPHGIPDEIVVETKFYSDVDPRSTLFVLAVPSSQVRGVARELAQHAKHPLVLSVSKGFDAERQCTMSELIRREIPEAHVVVLTGPTIANEISDGQPTRAVLACDDLMHLALVKETLTDDLLSFEVSRNPTHHEICAALKGIVAIAVGMAEGLGFGSNVRGVLIAAGLREMAVVASFFGVPEGVAYGVSGAGDLITTCTSPHSRNRRLGVLLAQGRTLPQALAEVGMTVEGVAMSKTIQTLWALDVSIPLFHMVHAILQGQDRDIRAELIDLISRR